MNDQYTPCCEDSPAAFLITYSISPRKFQVCNSCIRLEQYSRGIKEKIPISEIIGHDRPQTTSETEMVTTV